MRRLLAANAALSVMLAGHIADHLLRQPADQQLSLVAALPGLLGAVAVWVLLVFVVRGASWAPLVAVPLGLATALGFLAVHLLPHWSMFSDPYADRYLDAGSWIEMFASLVGGLWLAYEGWRCVTARGGLRRATAAPSR